MSRHTGQGIGHTPHICDAENSNGTRLDDATLVRKQWRSSRSRTRVRGGTIGEVAGVVVGISLLLEGESYQHGLEDPWRRHARPQRSDH